MQESWEKAQKPTSRLVGRLSNLTYEEAWEIRPNETLWIGRDEKRWYNKEFQLHEASFIVDLDPAISNWHARIYSILFDGGVEIDAVPPLVYVEDFSTNGTFWNGTLIGKGSAPKLLTHGDKLRVGPTTFHFFDCKSAFLPETLDELQQAEKKVLFPISLQVKSDVFLSLKLFQKRYAITNRKLGAGGFGSVHLALEFSTKRQLACKIVALRVPRLGNDGKPLRGMECSQIRSQRRLELQMREVEILKGLDHPNIIRLEKVFYSDSTMYIFTELMTAGDLFSYLEYKGGSLTYCESGVIVRQILKALEHLHAMEIVHRDVKPDNIFLTSLQEGARVVLGDFGWARSTPGDGKHPRRMHTFCGTKEYIAPEMYSDMSRRVERKGYTKAVDMWALGELTVVLFTGDLSSTPSVDLGNAMHPAQSWDFARLEAILQEKDVERRPKDFIKKLLVLDEAARLTATQALNHCWFTHEGLKDEWEAVYQRSLHGWKPRPSSHNIIEKLVLPESLANNSLSSNRSVYFLPEAPLAIESPARPLIRRQPSPLPSIQEEAEAAADEQRSERISSSQRPDPSRLPSLQNLDIQASPPPYSPQGSEKSPVSKRQKRSNLTNLPCASPAQQTETSPFTDSRTLEELRQASSFMSS
ncbi:MAG: hypothetical protein M1835_005124 [Candelina submexicana]|nr:MAG: hypothetical protein M1835_005124 [Candelina submexicana]